MSSAAAVLSASPLPRSACETHDLSIWQPDPEDPSIVFAWCLECRKLHRVKRQRPARGSEDPDRWKVLITVAAAPLGVAG